MYTEEDVEASGINQTKHPCPCGGIRVSLAHLPRGLQGPSQSTRGTMLPCFVAL